MSAKSQALAHEIADELKKRLSSLTLVEGFDSNGDATITLGSGTAGQKNAFIRVKAIDWTLAKNIIGLQAEVFGPSVIQFATEKNYEGATDNVTDILGPAELLPLLGTLLGKSARVEWYRSTNGTAPTVSTITGAPAASWENSLYWGMKASQ
jgi:hypothetical protein